jgi:hypothetical protein
MPVPDPVPDNPQLHDEMRVRFPTSRVAKASLIEVILQHVIMTMQCGDTASVYNIWRYDAMFLICSRPLRIAAALSDGAV